MNTCNMVGQKADSKGILQPSVAFEDIYLSLFKVWLGRVNESYCTDITFLSLEFCVRKHGRINLILI